MSLQELLLQKRADLVELWFQRVLDTYPPDTARFLRGEPDRIANPVGQTILPALDRILEAFLSGRGGEDLSAPLDDVVRIRAVQQFEPSRAVGFVRELKLLLRDVRGDLPGGGGSDEEWRRLEDGIDALQLQAFDNFMECRETLYDIRARELRAQTAKLLERARFVVPPPGEEPDVPADGPRRGGGGI
jgi:hypothetical protein